MYSFTSRVRYSECDGNLTLTIPAAMNYLQDSSMFHCEHIGHGFDYCAQQGFAWFVVAWQIRFNRLPAYGEDIRMRTWCGEMGSALAKRSYTIEDMDGSRLVEADSLCVLVNTQTGRPIRIPRSEYAFVSNEYALDLPPTKRKLRIDGTLQHLYDLPVTEHLIDTNNHVNNVQYVSIADEAVRTREPDFELGTLLVQYKVAAHLGDTMRISLCEEETGYAVDLGNGEGGSFAIVRLIRR